MLLSLSSRLFNWFLPSCTLLIAVQQSAVHRILETLWYVACIYDKTDAVFGN